VTKSRVNLESKDMTLKVKDIRLNADGKDLIIDIIDATKTRTGLAYRM